MCGGLLLTAAAAVWTVKSAAMRRLVFAESDALVLLLIAETALVFVLSVNVRRLGRAAAASLFVGYSLLNGFLLSGIALAHSAAVIVPAFATAGAMYGVMSVVGMTTRRDVTSSGGLLLMGLAGLAIATALHLFLRSSALNFALSVAGVAAFVGLTASGARKLKPSTASEEAAAAPSPIAGALALSLDFLNLFLLLQILAGRRPR
jgi:FtsH-binding integral membrane protein